jgi:hypothetical protein
LNFKRKQIMYLNIQLIKSNTNVLILLFQKKLDNIGFNNGVLRIYLSLIHKRVGLKLLLGGTTYY